MVYLCNPNSITKKNIICLTIELTAVDNDAPNVEVKMVHYKVFFISKKFKYLKCFNEN